ncbi:CHAT domain-containing protein [Mycena albidolilacea]|uniref:CHAT domain-containing protein n=1 Tax=Mycena albidolilacea TaxID=1033008 RepID=A0AAD6Z882_9AGAR|nr:CHAT domain-containing protein [Mycena albidolilacea]
MSGLKKVIQLHSIRVTSSTNPHDDLPGGMKISAQLIIEDVIFLQTLPVASEHDEMNWKLVLGCTIPLHALTFSVAVLRQSETEGTRLVGYVEICRGEVLRSVEWNRSFQLQLSKVNPDGPSLEFSAGFSVFETPYQGPSGLNLIRIPENTIASVKGRSIESDLRKMHEAFTNNHFSMDGPQLRIMHERLLFCKGDETRAQWLNRLGDILLQGYQESGTVDDLVQAVCSYNDAVRDDPGSTIYLADLGRSLRYRFERLGSLLDINRSIGMLEAAVEDTQGDRYRSQLLSDLGASLLSRFEKGGDLLDLQSAVLRFEAAVALIPDGHPDKPLQLSNLGNSLCSRFEQLGGLDDLDRSVVTLEAAVTLTPDSHPDKPSLLNNLGKSLVRRFQQRGGLDDLNQSILRFEVAVTLSPDGNTDKPTLLSNLGSCLLSRFKQLGDLADLQSAMLRFEAAVTLTPDDHPAKPPQLNNLGTCLLSRFHQFGDLPDLQLAVLRFDAAVTFTPDGHPDKPSLLSNLGGSLLKRFEQLGHLSDLQQAVLRFEAGVVLAPDGHPDKPSLLNNLGNSFLSRFKRLGHLPDLQLAVLRFEAAVSLTPNGHMDKPSLLNNLGSSLLNRFEQLGDLPDLQSAVLTLETAVTLTPDGHPDKPSRLNNLGDSFLSRYKRLGDLPDLQSAVLQLEAAISLTLDSHPAKPSWLNNLGTSLFNRFKRLGHLPDLQLAVLRFQAAVRLTPDCHLEKPSRLNNLGGSLLSRFEQLGNLPDLQSGILRIEAAVALISDGDPDKPSLLSNLGYSLVIRFKRLGDLLDLQSAVLCFEAAVTLTPDGHLAKPSWLNNLGTSLLTSFEQLGHLPDLQSAVLRLEAAVTLTQDGHPAKPSRLNNLGNSLSRRFEKLGALPDLQSAVLRFEAAIALTPDGHPDKPSMLINLGDSLHQRWKLQHHPQDSQQLIFHYMSAACSATGPASVRFSAAERWATHAHIHQPSSIICAYTKVDAIHPRRTSRESSYFGCVDECTKYKHNNLYQGKSLRPDSSDRSKEALNQNLWLHRLCSQVNSTNNDTAPEHQSAPSISANFGVLESAANYGCKWAVPIGVDGVYLTAIELLPELAWLGSSIPDRHHRLLQVGEVVRAAASAAIAVKDYQQAVEWLDQGRSVIWGQLLNLRTPVDELRKSHPGLANELVSVSTSLETAGTWGSTVAEAIATPSLQSIAEQSHDLALKRVHVLKQIRELPGFERFLLSKPISELMLAANRGPVAILNTSEYGCDALILMPGLTDEIIHVPLSNFTIHEVQALAKSLASIVGTTGRSERLDGFREGDMAPHDVFSHILSDLWFKVVQPVLNQIGVMTPVRQDLGRIWWCPTGPLAFLPIHAAGLYGEDRAIGSKLSDFLISSYTPSLTALIEGLRPQFESKEELQLLAVTQASANGQDYIPGTRKEIQCIQQHTSGKVHVHWLDGQMATIENVEKGLLNSRWVHFACHGVQMASPTESALLLAGSSRLTLSNIIQLSLPSADLAFLSACQTATGSKDLQDESVHLAAGMLLAGYRGVIGTMWSIMDQDAPQVAGDVYAHLLEASPPDPRRAAEALHLAVCKLREQKKSFLRWVPFIHFGA